jgi:hypothetical protein
MAVAFQQMLECFGVTEKVLAVNADNATSNDTQTKKLDTLDNSFEESNRIRCFNHTMQLSAKALLAPFKTALSRKGSQDNEMPEGVDDNDMPLLEEIEEEEDDDNGDNDGGDDDRNDDGDDGIDELEELSESERSQFLANTAVVHETVTKVSDHEVSFFKHVLIVSISTGSTTCIRNHPLDNNCPPCVASHLL